MTPNASEPARPRPAPGRGRLASATAIAAGNAASTNASPAAARPVGRAAGAAARRARRERLHARRSRSPRPRGTRPTCQKLQPSTLRRKTGRPTTNQTSRAANRKMRAAASTLTARSFENICAKRAPAVRRARARRASAARTTTSGRPATSRPGSSSAGRKPTTVSSRPPRKKPTPLSAFFEPVRIATQRKSASGAVVGNDELDRALRAHLGQVLGDPRERLRGHHVRHRRATASGAKREHRERDDLRARGPRAASP